MTTLRIPDNAAPHINALRELIRTGAVASPVLEESCLIDLPVVRNQSGSQASKSKRAYIFTQVLRQVINRHLEGNDARTANILFAFDDFAGLPIQDRYRSVAKLYNPHWTWENYRKEPLTRHLLAIYLALEREAEIMPVTPDSNNKLRRGKSGLVGQDWTLESCESIFTLPSREGEPLENIQTRRLRATCEQIGIWRQYAYVREYGTSAIPQLTLFGPGEVSITDTYVDSTGMRIYVIEVRFPTPIRYGETIEFTLLRRVDVRFDQVVCDNGWDWYGLVTLKSPAQYVKIGVQLPTTKLPQEVWRYKDIISGLIRPGTPTSSSLLAIDSTGFVSNSWTNLSAGYSYGIALNW